MMKESQGIGVMELLDFVVKLRKGAFAFWSNKEDIDMSSPFPPI
jgi:hypothetical protein